MTTKDIIFAAVLLLCFGVSVGSCRRTDVLREDWLRKAEAVAKINDIETLAKANDRRIAQGRVFRIEWNKMLDDARVDRFTYTMFRNWEKQLFATNDCLERPQFPEQPFKTKLPTVPE